jgi:AcrR family transcriptional regulator
MAATRRTPSPSRARRTLLPRAERREQLLQAALHAFERGGYHGTHVDDVIREAGVARGTFYLHFPSKHAVFSALVDQMLGLFLEVKPAEPEPDVRTAADAEAILRRSYRTVFETFRRHRRLCRLLFEEAVGVDKGFTTKLSSHFGAWHDKVARTLRHFASRGVVRRDLDVPVTSDLLVGMVVWLARRYLFADRAPDLDRLVDAVVALELRGILA